jgi:ribose-phosphate pyrophosphokinase
MSLKSTFKVVTEHEELYPDFIRFSGGEINVKLTSDLKPCIFYRIVANIVDAEGIMQLLLLKDAIDREGWNKAGATSTLVLPYLPYSRQDRVCNKGES